jgi:2-keto-4-pentenoate hydratase/2-oxohepta-3-ene-1,7-dioic acid hydratase in catechol pathway
LDITDRDLQSKLKAKRLPCELPKSFDGSAVISDFVSIEIDDIQHLHFKAYKNNNLIQESRYDLMIYKPSEIVNFLKSSAISICKNDLLIFSVKKLNVRSRF